MSKKDEVLGHSDEADGIEEYDNALPLWWLGILYFSIGFAIFYTVDYHFLSHRSQAKEFDAEIAAANEKWPAPAAGDFSALKATPELVEAGKGVFQTTCASCHGPEGKGGIGPDLTDGTWIHGGTMPDIAKTVTDGVKDKGMPTWGPILGPEKVGQVSAFVHSLGGGQ